MRVNEPELGRRYLVEGLPDDPVRVSRRHRVTVLTMDINGAAAAVTFASRPKRGRPELDIWMNTWTYHLRDGEWHSLGGGGGNTGCAALGPRPSKDVLGGYAITSGSSWTSTATRVIPFRRPAGISECVLRASAEVDELRVGDRRMLVRDHGFQVLVWTKRRAPTIEAWAENTRVAVLDLRDAFPRHRSMPLRARFGFARRARSGVWGRS